MHKKIERWYFSEQTGHFVPKITTFVGQNGGNLLLTVLLMDNEVTFSAEAHLLVGVRDTAEISPDGMMTGGAIMLCKKGSATILVNYKPMRMEEDSVMTLFPGDLVSTSAPSEDFALDALCYSPSILREASLDLEHTVYSSLREDRCRGGSHIVTEIVSGMFSLLLTYFRQRDCRCLTSLVICQLKAFFIGFHDYLIRFPSQTPTADGSKRERALFDNFMRTLESDYKKSREVSYYADRLNITPKYLNVICKHISSHNTKSLIDHYAILKLKLDLSGSDQTIRQIVWEYNFSDPSFFTRYFKLHTGLTPLAYRKAHYKNA